jgi:2-polyprenyl-3-methyl-5-hydroxy-6-metoxy-1,4-benzoquinol methylase
MNRFDMAALTWDEKPARVNIAKNVAEKIKELVPLNQNMKVLDFGCGTGLLSFFLQPYAGEITGIDTSKGMIEVFDKKIKENQIENMKCLNLDIYTDKLSEKYDLIVSSMVFHHIKDISQILKILYNYLNEDGYIAIADLVKEDGSFHDDNEGVEHFGFEIQEMENKLKEVGFKEIKSEIAHIVKKQRENEEREYPIFLIVGRK